MKDFNKNDVIEIVEALLDYSRSKIIRSNFIEAFKNYTVNNRLYGTYKLFGALSFRLTSSEPNLLNTPSTGSVYAKLIKQCFVAEKDHIFCMIDFAALEDRVMANVSRDNNKCSIFLDNIDGHCLNSYYYFKDEIEKILPRNKGEELKDYIKRYKAEIENGNKTLKGIRQKSKSVTFANSYGAYPPKIAQKLKCSLAEATKIWCRYHEELYPKVTLMRNKVLAQAKKEGRIHLGLGCYVYTDDPEKDIRSINNACCQFWSILSLLTINKIMSIVEENNLTDQVEVVSSIYDSIYFHVKKNPKLIKWLNDRLIPIMTKDFLIDIIVHNEAELEIGYNWYDTVPIPNNASLFQIKNQMSKLDNLD